MHGTAEGETSLDLRDTIDRAAGADDDLLANAVHVVAKQCPVLLGGRPQLRLDKGVGLLPEAILQPDGVLLGGHIVREDSPV